MGTVKPDELVARLFERLDAIVSGTELVAERIERDELRSESFSVVGREVADGATATVVRVAPRAGAVWEIKGIAVQADAAARAVAIAIGPNRPVASVLTDAATGIGQVTAAVFTLPDGSGVEVTFPAAVALGSGCVVHVWGHQQTPGL